jgi:hypothetical protein
VNIRPRRILFVLHQYRSVFIKILIALCIDVLVLLGLVLWINATPDISIAGSAVIPSLIVINIGLTVVARFTLKKFYLTFLFNIVLAPLIFYGLCWGWLSYQGYKNFIRWQFPANGKHYELLLDKRDTSYSFSELSSGSSMQFMRGQYRTSHDTVYLTDPVNQMIIYKDTLIGFSKESIVLKEE